MKTSMGDVPARWPDVPACYGWLSLDRRGVWRLQGEPVTHSGLLRLVNGNYRCDAAGNWLVDNGPQRVFVALDYAPWVFRLDVDGSLSSHTGAAAGMADAAFLDADGNVLLHTCLGAGLLDDRDLGAFIAACADADGAPADEQALLDVMAGGAGVFWRGLPLLAIACADVPARFGFIRQPMP